MTITRNELELAALAAGIKLEYRHTSDAYYYDDPETGREEWRPHTDTNNAVRLAGQLRMAINFSSYYPHVDAWRNVRCNDARRAAHDGSESEIALAFCEAVVLCAAAAGERLQLAQRINATPEQVAGSLAAVDEYDAAKKGGV